MATDRHNRATLRIMGMLRTQRAICALLEHIENLVPDARLGNTSTDPFLWLPAPAGFAVWVMVRGRKYVAVISRGTQPPTVTEATVGASGEDVALVWDRASRWLKADIELSNAWRGARSAPPRAAAARPPRPPAPPAPPPSADQSPPLLDPDQFWDQVRLGVYTYLDDSSQVSLDGLDRLGPAVSVLVKSGEILVFTEREECLLASVITLSEDNELELQDVRIVAFNIDFAEPVSVGLVATAVVIMRLEEIAATEGISLRERASAEEEAKAARLKTAVTLAVLLAGVESGGPPWMRAAAARLVPFQSYLVPNG